MAFNQFMVFLGLEILLNDRSLYNKYIFKRLTVESFQRRISGPRQKHSCRSELSGFKVTLPSLERFLNFIILFFFHLN